MKLNTLITLYVTLGMNSAYGATIRLSDSIWGMLVSFTSLSCVNVSLTPSKITGLCVLFPLYRFGGPHNLKQMQVILGKI